MSTPRTARSYPELIAALIQRRNELGMTQRDLEQVAGLPDGYIAKIEASRALPKPYKSHWNKRGIRTITAHSLEVILEATNSEIKIQPRQKMKGTP